MPLIKPGDVIDIHGANDLVVTWSDDKEVRAERVIRYSDKSCATQKLVLAPDDTDDVLVHLWREVGNNAFGIDNYEYGFEWFIKVDDKIKQEGQEKTLAKAIEMAYDALGGK